MSTDYLGARFPIDKLRITLPFAAKSAPYSELNPHKGVDLAPFSGSEGQPIYMPWTGSCLSKGYHATAGNYLIFQCNFPFTTWASDLMMNVREIKPNEVILLHLYHLKDMFVKAGEIVSVGKIIGTIGNTGKSFGPHLHMEVRLGENSKRDVVNPLHLLKATIVGLSLP